MASFGDNLRRERELRGITLREIAEATKISRRFLQALEQDRMDVLPGGLFPRAFVRQYARHLGLDAEKLVAEYLYLHGEARPERRPPPPPRRQLKVSPGTLFFGAVALAAVVLSFRRSSEDGARKSAALPSPSAPAQNAVLPSDRVYPPPGTAATAAATPAPSQGLVLTLTAQQSCWVEARADGQTVISRVLAEGETQTLEAEGEIVLSVGNAGGLAISVNDQPGMPLGKSGEVKKNIVITRQNLPTFVPEVAERDAHSS
jgi:transcriptional regulator with XRE-family HTH domain